MEPIGKYALPGTYEIKPGPLPQLFSLSNIVVTQIYPEALKIEFNYTIDERVDLETTHLISMDSEDCEGYVTYPSVVVAREGEGVLLFGFESSGSCTVTSANSRFVLFDLQNQITISESEFPFDGEFELNLP